VGIARRLRTARSVRRYLLAVVQRRGSGTNVTDSPVSADVGVVTDAGAATSSTSLQADIAVNIDVAGRATTQRVLVSYIPTMSRYTAIIGAAEDQAHLKHPEALDSSSNVIVAAVTRCMDRNTTDLPCYSRQTTQLYSSCMCAHASARSTTSWRGSYSTDSHTASRRCASARAP
jgi:hypothetical protein